MNLTLNVQAYRKQARKTLFIFFIVVLFYYPIEFLLMPYLASIEPNDPGMYDLMRGIMTLVFFAIAVVILISTIPLLIKLIQMHKGVDNHHFKLTDEGIELKSPTDLTGTKISYDEIVSIKTHLTKTTGTITLEVKRNSIIGCVLFGMEHHRIFVFASDVKKFINHLKEKSPDIPVMESIETPDKKEQGVQR